MSDRSILYIEDEEDYQILVQRILNRAGWTVTVAGTGAEGLAMLRQTRPSLLLLDINLPDTDGYAICQQLRQETAYQDLPILMLTVRRRPEEWLRGFSCGANDYLSKPFDPKGLLERVENGLSGQTLLTTSGTAPEYQLIQAAASGNRAAFEVLIQKYKDRLTESIRQAARVPADAEDIVAHAFLRAFENLKEFRGDASFYTWVYRIAMNESIAVQRKSHSVSIDDTSKGEDSAHPAKTAVVDTTEQNLSDREEVAHLRRVIGEIPPVYRETLEMHFLKDMSYEAIGQALDIPLGTVMSRLFKARTLMKEIWERHESSATRSRLAPTK